MGARPERCAPEAATGLPLLYFGILVSSFQLHLSGMWGEGGGLRTSEACAAVASTKVPGERGPPGTLCGWQPSHLLLATGRKLCDIDADIHVGLLLPA